MADFIDLTYLQYNEAFKFKKGKKVYWAIGFCNNYESFAYCDIHNKIHKKSVLKTNLVQRIQQ